MASDRDSISNINDNIEGSFDVDVVGLTDLVEFKSDGELYDFESGEFGLFGEDGVPLQQNSSYSSVSSGERELFTLGSPHQNHDVEKNSKQKKRIRKNKIWNEMEKDLFLKGLELFGENWRKISKFITTKTLNQVKLYHKQWAETANVIPDSVNLANDSSIYLPLDSNNDGYFTMGYSNPMGFKEKSPRKDTSSAMKPHDPNTSADSHASGSETDTDNSAMNFGDGIVVSSLHDWNLGSQVSVTEEESPADSPLGHLSIICEKKTAKKPRKVVKRNNPKVSKRKKDNPAKVKKKGRKRSPSLLTKSKFKNATRNIIGAPKTISLNEGQIILLDQNETEDSDIDIDDSDSEKSTVCLVDELTSQRKGNFIKDDDALKSQRDEFTDQRNKCLRNEDKEFQDLSDVEKSFFYSLELKGKMSATKYILIRNKVIKEWEKFKPSILTKNQIGVVDFDGSVAHDVIYEIYDFLEENFLINSVKRKGPVERLPSRRKKCPSERLRLDMMKRGGGVTLSHDASGAVINALHIPDSSSSRANEGKKISAPKDLKLLNCLQYDPDSPAPFATVFHPQAATVLDLHCHSSSSEVIGLLGGYLDHSASTLYITTVAPTEASSSGVDCEMSPLSQIKAVEQIGKNGVEVVGWYHSHPSFLPNPSQRDLDTQAQLQNWFKRSDAPFIGVIVSPFRPAADSESSEIRCFFLDAPPSRHADGVTPGDTHTVQVPYRLRWKILQQADLKWEEVERSIVDILQKSKDHSRPVNWKQQWKNGISYLDKLCASLKFLLPHDASKFVSMIHHKIMTSVT